MCFFFENDHFWANEATHNAERPTVAFEALHPGLSTVVMDIAPGFAIENGVVICETLRQPITSAELRAVCAKQIDRANRHGSVEETDVQQVAGLLEGQLVACTDYLRSHDGDYRFLIRLRQSALGIVVQKSGDELRVATHLPATHDKFDLMYTTRLAYLRRALTEPFGDEILFVGSGGIFEYPDQVRARTNVHREFIELIRGRKGPLRRPRGLFHRLASAAKQSVKRLLGREPEVDLYDLAEWTVFEEQGA